MRKIIIFILLAHLLMASTCRNKATQKNTIIVENRIDKEVFLFLQNIKYDFGVEFNEKTKKAITANYNISPLSKKKMFYTPFCMKDSWESVVIGDTLEILVFSRDTLEKDKTLEELVSDKSYIRKIKRTYNQLISDSCKVVIE
jgi:hypothetical protein